MGRCALLAGSSFASFGALLGGGGLAQAFGFQSGFGLLGLLFDLVELIELARHGSGGRQCEGGAQNNVLHVLRPQLFFGSGQVAFGWMRVSLEMVMTIREMPPTSKSHGRPTWAEV